MTRADFDFQDHAKDEADRKNKVVVADLRKERQEQIELSKAGKTVDPAAMKHVSALLLQHLVAREAAAQDKKITRP